MNGWCDNFLDLVIVQGFNIFLGHHLVHHFIAGPPCKIAFAFILVFIPLDDPPENTDPCRSDPGRGQKNQPKIIRPTVTQFPSQEVYFLFALRKY